MGTRPGGSPAIRAGKGWRGRRELAPRCFCHPIRCMLYAFISTETCSLFHRQNHHHHHHHRPKRVTAMLLALEPPDGGGSDGLRSMLRHKRQTVAMELAAALHHSRDVGPGTNDGLRADDSELSWVRGRRLLRRWPSRRGCPRRLGAQTLVCLSSRCRCWLVVTASTTPLSAGSCSSSSGRGRGRRRRRRRRRRHRLRRPLSGALIVDSGRGMCRAGFSSSRCVPFGCRQAQMLGIMAGMTRRTRTAPRVWQSLVRCSHWFDSGHMSRQSTAASVGGAFRIQRNAWFDSGSGR